MPRCGASLWRRGGICLSVTLVLPVIGIGGANADDAAAKWSLHGFGTLGMVEADVKGADFVASFVQPDGAGFTRRWSAGVDSRLGAQLDVRLSSELSAVLQLVAQHRYDKTYTPQIEWANLKYQPTPDFSLRVGRSVTEQFMESDARLVSYTGPWLRPPQEVYGLVPVTNKDGVDVSYRLRMGGSSDTVRVSLGQTKVNLAGGGDIKGRRFLDVNDTLEIGATTLRVGYTSLQAAFHNPGMDALFGGLTQFGATAAAIPGLETAGVEASALVRRYRIADFPYSVLTVGARYEPEPWLLVGEWASADGSGLIADAKAWYLTAAYRWNKVTPYLTYARLTSTRPVEPGITLAGLPPPLAQAAAALNAGLDATIHQFASSQRSVAVGLRWDVLRSASLKVQADHVELGSGSSGRLGNAQPSFQGGQTFNVLAAAVEFVF